MTCFTRCLFILACLLLLTSVVPPQPALAGDPDEIIERTPPLPPFHPQTPPESVPGGHRGDPDEMPDGSWGEEGGGPGGLDYPGEGSGLRGAGGWIPVMLEILRYGVLVAY